MDGGDQFKLFSLITLGLTQGYFRANQSNQSSFKCQHNNVRRASTLCEGEREGQCIIYQQEMPRWSVVSLLLFLKTMWVSIYKPDKQLFLHRLEPVL